MFIEVKRWKRSRSAICANESNSVLPGDQNEDLWYRPHELSGLGKLPFVAVVDQQLLLFGHKNIAGGAIKLFIPAGSGLQLPARDRKV